MVTFVDTSALYAVLDANDANHAAAAGTFTELLDRGERLVTHNYVVLETTALVQRRLGVVATRVFHDDVVPAMEVVWIDEDLHRAAVDGLLGAGRRDISLVDWASFITIRRHGLGQAFVFDADFAAQGIAVVPESPHAG